VSVSAESSPSTLYNRVELHTASLVSPLIAFLWGVAEAMLFFIVPDVYLGVVALINWRRGLLATAAAVAGAILGGAIMYALAAAHGTAIDQLLDRVPLISPQIVNSVSEQMQSTGLRAMVGGPQRGIPYKIYAAQAGQQHLPFMLFLLVTIPARLARILPFALPCAAFGVLFKSLVQRRTRLVLFAYALFWVGIYVSYYLRFR
jgi:membrane protein DedA with SNARE-associated domain